MSALLGLSFGLAAQVLLAPATEFGGGRLLVVCRNSNAVLELPILATASTGYRVLGLGSNAPGAWDCAFGPDGFLWVSSLDGDRVVGFDAGFLPQGTIGPGSTLDGADGICFGPGGNLFVASTIDDEVLEFAPGGAVAETYGYDAVKAPIDGPTGVAISPEGRLLAGGFWTDSITSFDLGGYPAATATGGFVRPELLTPSVSGGLFVASSGNGATYYDSEASLSGLTSQYDVGPVSDPKRLLFAPDGVALVSSFADDKIETSTGGAIQLPELDGPIGMAIVPYRFTARVKGKIHSATAGELAVDEMAVLSVLPNSATAMLRLPELPFANALAPWSGSRDFVFQGFEGRRADGKGSLWRGTQIPRDLEALARGTIALRLKFQLDESGRFVRVKSAKGTLAIERRGFVFEGTVSTKQALN